MRTIVIRARDRALRPRCHEAVEENHQLSNLRPAVNYNNLTGSTGGIVVAERVQVKGSKVAKNRYLDWETGNDDRVYGIIGSDCLHRGKSSPACGKPSSYT